ncbi:MAG: protein kinase [Myxococcales bacterium]|nr:protein kinase [Myxococcales bacterium]
MKLWIKIALALLGVSLLSVGGLAYVLANEHADNMAASARVLRTATAESVRVKVDVFLSRVRNTIGDISAALTETSLTQEQRVAMVRSRLRGTHLLDRVEVFSPDGELALALQAGASSAKKKAATALPAPLRTKLAAQAGDPLIEEHPEGPRPYLLHTIAIKTAQGRVYGFLRSRVSMKPLIDAVSEAAQRRLEKEAGGGLYVVDRQQRVLARGGAAKPSKELMAWLRQSDQRLTRPTARAADLGKGSARRLTILLALPAVQWGVVVQQSNTWVYLAERAAWRYAAIAGGVVALLALVVGLLLGRRIGKPVTDIARAAALVESGDFSARVTPRASDEVGALARSFNSMAGSLEESRDRLVAEARVRANMSRYLSDALVEAIVDERQSIELGGKRAKVTVLFADVVAFTPLAERHAPEDVVRAAAQRDVHVSHRHCLQPRRHGRQVHRRLRDGRLWRARATRRRRRARRAGGTRDDRVARDGQRQVGRRVRTRAPARYRHQHRDGDRRQPRLGKAHGVHGHRRHGKHRGAPRDARQAGTDPDQRSHPRRARRRLRCRRPRRPRYHRAQGAGAHLRAARGSMICMRCGRDLVDGNCPSCGVTLPPPERTQAPSTGETLAQGANVGGNAGTGGLGSATTEPASTDALIGQLINKRFRIRSFLGEGAMGLVYRAEQIGLARDVAIKFVHRHLVDSRDRLLRFEREALALSKLEHPGIVAIYDYGQWNDQSYIAMQYLSGQSLESLVKSSPDKRLPLAETVRIVGEICDALDVAHAAGVVHRDLKPENVMLADPDKRVKIVDFGIAKIADSAVKLTREGDVLGTPAYMAPEQCAGEPIGPQTDIYALGVILYELLTGGLPFKAPTVQALIFKHVLDDPSPPSEAAPDVHGALDEITLWALRKRRETRPASAGALKARLLEALDQIEGRSSDQHRRKTGTYAATRAERSAVLGDAPPRAPRIEPEPAEGKIIAVDHGAAGAPDAPTTHLRRAGYRVVRADSPAAITPDDEKAIVVDLGAQPRVALDALAPLLADGKLSGLPVVVVGPDDAMDEMSRALALKIAAYVPRSKLQRRLLKAVRRATRR